MFSELRKMQVSFIVAHQYLTQLNVKVRDAVIGNVTNMVIFRLSYQDAKYFAQEFYPIFTAHDFVSLENYHIYLRLLIHGKPCRAFSAKTLPSEVFKLPDSNT